MNGLADEKLPYNVRIAEAGDDEGTLVITCVPVKNELAPARAQEFTLRAQQESGEWKLTWNEESDTTETIRPEIQQDILSRLHDRTAWIDRVTALVADVQRWGEELGWSTRRVEKKLDDARVGKHRVPALLLQEEACRVFLEPLGRTTPGTQGAVDLYLMPAYDDIASLYYYQSQWHLHSRFAVAKSVDTIRDADSVPLSKATLEKVLSEMRLHAV